MFENIYKIEGKYPDPYQIERQLRAMKKDPGLEREYANALAEIKSSGMSTHPLLERFFVES